ncbi:aldose 1-epimerase family protein [Mucilaginibacter robiniae]|uniref:Aldose 1-epimerase family protein n=1 Tax=Mucilaginibacter robiniae TaxID=2728022 RepID=A0A7L5E509_9SPHI|nr:aldose 1-epimerase family protein [Mucilaginibacter robiniae]QJD97467.1 aldose 1-epimerase family protein [Mucilaginibacter robiniae]
MTTIENEYLKVIISSQGAQLTSIYNKAAQIEHLWQADAQVWPWHAPNLFPVVGGLVDNQLHVNSKQYALARHGFARQSTFRLVEAISTRADFSLSYSETTLAAYPYKFIFHVIYDLLDNALRITYKVINSDTQTIYFSVGGHPAFNVPMGNQGQYEDYYLEFELTEKLEKHLLSAEGYFTGQTLPVVLQGNQLPLTQGLFKDDALVFKNIQSKQITIKSKLHEHTLSVEYPHYKHLGIWAKPDANFVCIEPWLGYADDATPATDISQKPAIQKLEPGHVFEAPYYISI